MRHVFVGVDKTSRGPATAFYLRGPFRSIHITSARSRHGNLAAVRATTQQRGAGMPPSFSTLRPNRHPVTEWRWGRKRASDRFHVIYSGNGRDKKRRTQKRLCERGAPRRHARVGVRAQRQTRRRRHYVRRTAAPVMNRKIHGRRDDNRKTEKYTVVAQRWWRREGNLALTSFRRGSTAVAFITTLLCVV